MKVVYVTPGFGGTFYCENCTRDTDLLKVLGTLGHDVMVAPMYLPVMMSHDKRVVHDTIFYGAVNVYLKENVPLFNYMPEWMERFFNAGWLLNLAAKKSGSTDARGLEGMTISVLKGEAGNQAKELDMLISWLKHEIKPDLVHLSNVLLIGLAKRIRTELDIPVVCTLQDEDTWIDQMDAEYAADIWRLIEEKARYVDAFISVSHYYNDLMMQKLTIEPRKMHVIYNGITLSDYRRSALPLDEPVIGFLSRICIEFGIDILIKAFMILKKDSRFAGLKLRVTGGMTGSDKKDVKRILRGITDKKVLRDIEIVPDAYKEDLASFLASLTVLSVPMTHGEAFGTYLIKALAAGVPVVQPEVAGYKEVIDMTQGGLLYTPNTPERLAATLESLLTEPVLVRDLGQKGWTAVREHFDITGMAHKMIDLYEKTVETGK